MNNWVIWGVIILIVWSVLHSNKRSNEYRTKPNYPTSTYYNSANSTTYNKPNNATALCRDGTYSNSSKRNGTCSHHGGVKYWLNDSQSMPSTTTTYTYTPPPTPSYPTTATAECWNGEYSYSVHNTCVNQGGIKRSLNGYQPITTTNQTNNNGNSNTNNTPNPFETQQKELETTSQTPSNPPELEIQEATKSDELEQDMTVAEIIELYELEVAHINQAWQALDPDVRKNLRPEQREINKQRESECTAYGKTQSNVAEIQLGYRYLCEIPKLQERTKYLQELTDTTVIKLLG